MLVKKVEESSEKYHGSNPISRSKLFRMVKNGQVCPQNYKYFLENPQEDTDALRFGRAFHKAVLEPHDFENEFAVCPVLDRRTKEGKLAWSEFVEKCGTREVITFETYTHIVGMVNAIKNDPYASALINGEVEKSYYWTDELTGIDVKCRPDVRIMLGDRPLLVDLKSTNDASTDNFSKECIKFGYDFQSAFYKEGADAFYSTEHGFCFIAVEKTPPYAVNVLEADELFIARGRDLYRRLLGELNYCQTTNDWYGYEGSRDIGGINKLTLPAYLLKNFE